MVVIARDLGYIKIPIFYREKSIIFLARSRESIHKAYTDTNAIIYFTPHPPLPLKGGGEGGG
jgi:hypothetical protein